MAPSRMWTQCLFLGICATVCIAVDKSNFKTCDQSGFCKRHRNMAHGASPYVVLLDQLTLDNFKAVVPLLNTKNNVQLKLEIFALKNNMARLRLDEMTPIKLRYQPPVGDVLIGEPAQDSLTKVQQDSNMAVFAFGDNKLILRAQPFSIEFVSGGVPVITVNGQGLLKFEHYRIKEQGEPAEEAKVEEEVEGEEKEEGAEEGEKEEKEKPQEEKKDNEDDEPGMWEENFKTHKDTKPFGPSSVGLDVSFPGFEHVYGIPEHADSLALKSTSNSEPYRLYNLDVFEYDLNNPMALYGSVPVMLAHNEERTVGIFWLNAAETWIDIRSNKADKSTFSKLVDFVKGDQDIPQVDTHWISESGVIDLFLMFGPRPKDVFHQYATLTGTTPLPPLFALAYHQSRWNYNDEKDVAQLDENFDVHDIPLDVIWLDIEHTDGKRYFTFDKSRFPDPAGMLRNISSKGRKAVGSVDPHLKRDPNYLHYKEARDQNLFIKDRNGAEYQGDCWPGSSSWLDFLDPKVRLFWASKFQPSAYEGSTLDLFTWNDMNEPSVFNGPEITMHKDAKHYGDWEHRDVHNIYGMYQNRATVEGQLMRDPDQRPFVLSRAFFAGTQRYGAVWTGDNTGEWGHLKMSIPMLLSLNLAGITFSGADVGGFFKNPENELLTRWYQAAAYQPFFRAHAHLDTRRREPWLLPEDHMTVIREAVKTRYRLLPYWYTLFYQAEQSGNPPMLPLWVEFPKDKSTFTIEDEHLVGAGLLVHPVTDASASGVNVYLPGTNEVWYDMDTNKKYHGGQAVYVSVNLQKNPVFRRGGHIIPQRERIRRSSSLTYQDPFTLVVALDKQGHAEGEFYMDDYNSFLYKNGMYIHRKFTYDNGKFTSQNLNPEGMFTTPAWIEKITVIGLSTAPKSIQISGKDFSPLNLEFKYDAATQTLVIRKPGIGVNKDFEIVLN